MSEAGSPLTPLPEEEKPVIADSEPQEKVEDQDEVTKEESEDPSEPTSETLYIQNLNDKVKLIYMKTTLTNLFRHYGKVLDVVAHRNLRMRGQAFVSFSNADSAKKALKEVQKFPLYGKPMQISYARTRSEAVVKALTPAEYEAFHTERIKHKKRARWDNPVRKKLRMKKEALAAGAPPEASMLGPRRPVVPMPDEYLPPNKILFIQNLPPDTTKDTLVGLFSQYENFYEVRMIPTKKDIAFVEYADEGSSTTAKDNLHNYKIDGENKIKVCILRATHGLGLTLDRLHSHANNGYRQVAFTECYCILLALVAIPGGHYTATSV